MRANSSLFLVLQTLLLAGAAFAQETPPAEEPDAPPSVEAGDEASAGDGEQETDSTAEDEEDDDGFVPTEEIPADEPIPFPTDI